MDPTLEQYKQLLIRQCRGGSGDIELYWGSNRYQYGAGFGDVLRSIWRVAFPVLIRGAKTLFTSGVESLDKGVTNPAQMLRHALKPTAETLLTQAGSELSRQLLSSNNLQSTLPNPGASQVGTESSENTIRRIGAVATSQMARSAPARLDSPLMQIGTGLGCRNRNQKLARKSKPRRCYSFKRGRTTDYNF